MISGGVLGLLVASILGATDVWLAAGSVARRVIDNLAALNDLPRSVEPPAMAPLGWPALDEELKTLE